MRTKFGRIVGDCPDGGQVLQVLPTGKGADAFAYDRKRNRAFGSVGRDGRLDGIDLGSKRATIVQTLPTQLSARTIAVDDRIGRLHLTAATIAPAGGGRARIVPGSFALLVIGELSDSR